MTTPAPAPAECWCHAEHKLHVPADSHDGLCAKCRSRSPSACAKAHKREDAELGLHLLAEVCSAALDFLKEETR